MEVPSANDDERRAEPRISYRGSGTIISSLGNWNVYLINVSLQGALVAILEPHKVETEDIISLHLELRDGSAILMHGRVAHIQEHYLGLCCQPNGPGDQERMISLISALLRDSALREDSDSSS